MRNQKSKSKKILIIDDKEDDLFLLENILKNYGYKTVSAPNGAEALKRLHSDEGFDMIITDILMPVMDGFKLCMNVKKDEVFKNIPFIFHTAAFTDEKDEMFALKLGADKFILKPIEPEKLIKIIQDLLKDGSKDKTKSRKTDLDNDEKIHNLYGERLINRLEAKVLELENEIIKHSQTQKALKQSEEQFRSTFEMAGVGIAHVALNEHFLRANRTFCDILGHTEDEIVRLLTFQDITHSTELEGDINLEELLIEGKTKTHSTEKRFIQKDGSIIWVIITVSLVRKVDREPRYFIVVIDDITKRKQAEEELKQIEWLLSKDQLIKSEQTQMPLYGDLTELNTSRLILDSVGKDLLHNIVSYYMDLLGTSTAVYERDGSYAIGIFTSGWCQFLDQASRSHCRSVDNSDALKGGKWHCHESCWNDASKKAIESGLPSEIKCHGGLYIYAVPIKAGGKIVGAINFGHGDPPKEKEELNEIVEQYEVDLDILLKYSIAYKSRPPAIINIAKKSLLDSAMLIGEIIERKQIGEELRKNEEKFRAIFDNTFQFIALLRPDGTLIEVNRGPLDFAGIKRSDVINKPIWEAPWWTHSETLQNLMKKYVREAARGDFIRFEATHRGHDGILADIDTSLTPVKGKDGNIIYIIKEGRDITKLKKTAEKVDMLSLAVEQSPASIAITDIDGNIEYVNHKFCDLTGYAYTEVIGENPRILNTGEKSPEEYRKLWKTITSGCEWRGEFHNKKKNGELYWEYALISPISNNEGATTHFLAVKEDITERKKYDEALLESEEKFRIISSAAPDAIIMSDSNNVISYWNKAAQKIFGFTAEDAVGKKLHETIIPVRDHQLFLNSYKGFRSSGKGIVIGKTSEMTAKNKDGTEFTIEISITAVKLKNEWHSIAMLRNISERLRIEEKLRVSYKMASLGQLTAGVFHEILNPVNIISSHVQLMLMETEKGSKAEEDLKSIQEEITRIVKISDNLLRFARKGELVAEEQDLNDLLKKTLVIIKHDMELKNIIIIRNFENGLPRVVANADQLRQVFLNLIINASDAMPEGGTITISTQSVKQEDRRYVKIKVMDTGIGIESNNISSVFDPFFTTKEVGKGTGLGLSTSYGIIKDHGGEMRVNSKEEKGTTFIIDLPVSAC
jgi:PAS domain S-box-containing protein